MSNRVVVIGGSGHIGSWLTPMLVEAGHAVVCVSRGQAQPYIASNAWNAVEQMTLDRRAAEDDGTFGPAICALRPDTVIDLTCFTPGSAEHLVSALRGQVKQFLHCGTIWIHGMAVEVPTREEDDRQPVSEYGVLKAAIEDYLWKEFRDNGFPAAILHPGHLVGPGWMPLNPAANFNPQVFSALARGDGIALPNMGRETLNHVHAADVAQGFVKALENWPKAVGQSFHLVSSTALTMAGYAKTVANWYGQEARVQFLPWENWRETVSKIDAAKTWDHIARSPNCSIDKARRLLGYEPNYSPLEAIKEALEWQAAAGSLPALTL